MASQVAENVLVCEDVYQDTSLQVAEKCSTEREDDLRHDLRGCGKSTYVSRRSRVRVGYRGNRRHSGRGIQLHFGGEAGTARPSLTRDPAYDGRGAARVVEKIGWALCDDGTTVDTAGAVAAGVVVAGAVFGAQRAAADGTDGLQPAVPLVCGLADG